MSVPESFKALSANLVMRSGVDENHDQEHEVSSDAARLRVVNV